MQIGELVISKKGRDSGEYFFISEVFGEYVSLLDGKLRKVAKPKRKKIKHIATLNYIHEGLAHKFAMRSLVHDKEICSAIRKWKEENLNVEG